MPKACRVSRVETLDVTRQITLQKVLQRSGFYATRVLYLEVNTTIKSFIIKIGMVGTFTQ